MVVIRLARRGARNQPAYRLVAADQRFPRDGRFIEQLGYYHPGTKALSVKADRLAYWVGQGAQMSDTVKRLARVTDKKRAAAVDSA